MQCLVKIQQPLILGRMGGMLGRFRGLDNVHDFAVLRRGYGVVLLSGSMTVTE